MDRAGDSAMRIDERTTTNRDSLQDATARSNYLTNKIKLDEERDNLTDPDELEKHKEKYLQAAEAASSAFSDPTKRQKFLLGVAPHVEAAKVAVGSRAFSMKRDAYLAESQTDLDNLREAALKATGEEDRAQALRAGNDRIAAMASNGYISDLDAQKLRKNWVENYAVGRLSMLSPAQRVEALSGVSRGSQDQEVRAKDRMTYLVQKHGLTPVAAAAMVGNAWHESGGLNPQIKGDGGNSVGEFQFYTGGEQPALRAYATKNGRDHLDWQTQYDFVVERLKNGPYRGTFDKMMQASDPATASTIFSKEYERPRADVAHNDKRARWANRAIQLHDPNAKIGEVTSYAGVLPSDRRAGMLKQAEVEVERDRRAETREVQNLVVDDLASTEATGVGIEGAKLNRDRVAATLGEAAAKEWEASRVRAGRIHSALDGIETMPEADVEARLKSLEPEAGKEGFTEDMRAYSKARAKADKFLEARRADPALSVNALPQVRQVVQELQYDDINGVKAIKPESAQSLILARLKAQSELGIAEPMAVTRSEAAVIARQMRMIGEEQPERLKDFIGALDRTYGPHADQVLSSAMQHTKVNRELSVLASEMLRKVSAGVRPGPGDIRKAEELIALQSIERALPPPPLSRELTPNRMPISANMRRIQEAQGAKAVENYRRNQIESARESQTIPPEAVEMLENDPNVDADINVTYPGAAPKLRDALKKRQFPNGR